MANEYDGAKIAAVTTLENLPKKYYNYQVGQISFMYFKDNWSIQFNYGLGKTIDAVHWDLATAIHLLAERLEEELVPLEEY